MRLSLLVVLAFMVAGRAGAEDAGVRAANGLPIPGEVRGVRAEGLELETPRGAVLLPWPSLAPSTRYRHQPLFRSQFSRILSGGSLPYPDGRPEGLDPVPLDAPESPAARPPPAPALRPVPNTPEPVAVQPPPTRPGTPAAEPAVKLPKNPTGADLPEMRLKTPDAARYVGVRFGPGDNDVAYFVFDEIESRKSPARLWAYVPGHPKYDTPQDSRASGSASSFRSVDVEVRDGNALLQYEVTVGMQDGWHMMAEATRLEGVQRTQWLQYKKIAKHDTAAARIPIEDLRGELKLTVSAIDGGKKIIPRLMIGEWQFYPVSGGENTINLEIIDERNMALFSKKIRCSKSDFINDEAWATSPQRLKKDTPYTMKVTINPGPGFGEIKDEQPLTLIDLK